MTPKKNRVDSRNIKKIFAEGKTLSSPLFNLRFIKSPLKLARISVVAPKNLANTAAKRNSLRRRGYLALSKHLKDIPPGIVGALVFKRTEENVAVLEKEIKSLLAKLN